jgi:hypothetical protein
MGHVAEDYRHQPKVITSGDNLILPEAHLKWYDIRSEGVTFPAEIQAEARAFVAREAAAGRLPLRDDLGFVMLHLSGDSIYLLLVCTWRNNNEMWESVYAKDIRGAGGFGVITFGNHKGTICVWESGAVTHEHQAWTRYLYSARDEQAKLDYMSDHFSGTV